MSKTVAKRYVKALMEVFDDKELKNIALSFKELDEAFNSAKFKMILSSPDVSKDSKEKFVLSFLKNPNKKLSAFIKLLSENRRLLFLKSIYQELEFQISLKSNSYDGKVYNSLGISKEQINVIQEGFSKRFGAKISLEAQKSDYNGIKIQVDDLGIETSFSLDRLKAQMTEHILKAI